MNPSIPNIILSQDKPTLIIGNKNYSSWSLRGWLALHAFAINFAEYQIELFSQSAQPILAEYSPTGKVPVLIDNLNGKQQPIWDSLAIARYVNQQYLDNQGWGIEPYTAFSLACEMHSGFFALRSQMPMNIRATRRIELDNALLAEVAYVDSIFNKYRKQYADKGDYLFGEFSLIDCFYAPLAFRFATYGSHSDIELSEIGQAYCQALLAHPSMQEWAKQALMETSIVAQDEAGEAVV